MRPQFNYIQHFLQLQSGLAENGNHQLALICFALLVSKCLVFRQNLIMTMNSLSGDLKGKNFFSILIFLCRYIHLFLRPSVAVWINSSLFILCCSSHGSDNFRNFSVLSFSVLVTFLGVVDAFYWLVA